MLTHARAARVEHSHSPSPSPSPHSLLQLRHYLIKLCGIETDNPHFHILLLFPRTQPLRNPNSISNPFEETNSTISMANMIMASSKTQIPPSPSLSSPIPKPKFPLPHLSFPHFPKPQSLTLKSLSLSLLSASAASLSFAPPSLAEEIEKAALFDFNLTLPIIMAEFLFLMFALDKLYYTPLGNFMDQRDAAIKEKLSSVKDTSSEVKQLEDQAAAVMRAARAEIAAALSKMKKETQAEVELKLAEGRKKVEAELQEALANLEKQKEETVKALDSQIAALSQDIVKKVLPL